MVRSGPVGLSSFYHDRTHADAGGWTKAAKAPPFPALVSSLAFARSPGCTCARFYMEAEVTTGCDTLSPRALSPRAVPKAPKMYRRAKMSMISLMKLRSNDEVKNTRVCEM